MRTLHPAVLAAIGAAVLFGASTPLAKALIGDVPPLLLAGLLYLGSGIGLTLARLVRDRGWHAPDLGRHEWPWLLGAIGFGGVLAPVLLMIGLAKTPASTASLLLNLEAVFTTILAWVVFRENADRRVVSGVVLIVAGGFALAWPTHGVEWNATTPALLIVLACAAWAIDNNLTRKVSASDALFIAGLKGWVAGLVNVTLALSLGTTVPNPSIASAAMLVGCFGYGVSLVLFVLALRGLGTARTSAYFSIAPFVGVAIAVGFFGESATPSLWIAAALMAGGVWLHVTERHAHEHTHEALEHEHAHAHDEHHRHEHDFAWDGREPHSHPHVHAPMTHHHPHYPDIHHRHRHR
jgi:drug/metabolite transporter (DMT)-like permease